eukprot:CAMPEP_0197258416 /NCGR_PEP_ID=MMETSP1429-20130617/82009_1 /TAXON_ID=49237 /ORGANISM="Chaetoceros  sp., Strain UNC1202" /LENGTH=221 /DNA_ID=CAMNT_0042722521 /DNA_START=76 /DNA_END=741 /DNA_ORIENTATION=+
MRMGGYQLPYLVTNPMDLPPLLPPDRTFWDPDHPLVIQNHLQIKTYVKRILDEYDFIGVADRMDESLVALSFILDLDVEDVLYVANRRVSGGYDYNKKAEQCFIIPSKTSLTEEIKEYLDTEEYKAKHAGDNLLYQAVNKSLNATIESTIGRERFDSRMEMYRKYKEIIGQRCGGDDCGLCSKSGIPRFPDIAGKECFYGCIKDTLKEYAFKKKKRQDAVL